MEHEAGQQHQARAALEDVRRRQEAVGRELGRYRPTWWMTVLYVLGMYTVMATTELGTAAALPAAACGFGIMVVGVGLAIRRAARSGVGARHGTWSAWRVVAAAGLLAAVFAVFWLVSEGLEGRLAQWQVPFVAALPAALVTWFFAEWLWRMAFGPRPSAAQRAE